MNAVVELKPGAGALAPMSEAELVEVLQSSLYPGAALTSIKMVLGYCKAAGLDPMQKPVHIVPMWDGKAKQMRDVIMPGVGLYRTQASRTDRFAGQSEPEFGPMVTAKLGGVEITYPEWAKVTVKKLMGNGTVAQFTACEYWIENYAVKGGQEKSIAPNAMWMKRPRGQIAKCAAAQALRLAFPEMGAQPTAEEMEGKALDEQPERHMGAAEAGQPAEAAEPQKKHYPADDFDKGMAAWQKAVNKGKTPAEVLATVEKFNPEFALSDAQRDKILALKAAGAVTDVAPKVTFAQVDEKMRAARTPDQLNEAASLIEAVTDQKQQEELKATYQELVDAMNDAQPGSLV